jgi:hypothetical protein
LFHIKFTDPKFIRQAKNCKKWVAPLELVHLALIVLEVLADLAVGWLIREPSFWQFSQSKHRRRMGSRVQSNESL